MTNPLQPNQLQLKHAIELKNVRKVYRIGKEKVVAIDDVSLTINKGDICCLLGTSGSGKSTLLNLMAGLEKPTKGTIEIHKIPIHKLNERQLTRFRQNHVGFIFQSYNLLPTLTALENVSLPLTFRNVPKKIREQRAFAMLKAVGLESYVLHKPSQMSGGQQQRVGIARAFVTKAPVIFADEPTGNLDSKTTNDVINLMLNIARENGQTMIIVTHDQQIATHANRVITISDGNILT
ncbi:ABC transporter ATP-binding protein [Desulfuribacillus alkaliarsenatis]|uniref:Macrolide ABC transporter ATP-binding protein n=1 Tax=Desulfuribacillus alkaliarsenatis TaxID=766136 RepID=A0A1E5G1V3_9FIRM|nr:macrolide ABC transporter ATP-binding protein [Desulfuribacillus alkaliarsenatis]